MSEFLDKFSLKHFGLTREQAHAKFVCIRCKQKVGAMEMTDADLREYGISAVCPKCWAALFPEEEK